MFIPAVGVVNRKGLLCAVTVGNASALLDTFCGGPLAIFITMCGRSGPCWRTILLGLEPSPQCAVVAALSIIAPVVSTLLAAKHDCGIDAVSQYASDVTNW